MAVDLLGYLQRVYRLEQDKFTYEQSIRRIEKEIEDKEKYLSTEHKFKRSIPYKESMPHMPVLQKAIEEKVSIFECIVLTLLTSWLVLTVVCVIPTVLLPLIFKFDRTILQFILLPFGILFPIITFIRNYKRFKKYATTKQATANKAFQEKYDAEMRAYSARVKEIEDNYANAVRTYDADKEEWEIDYQNKCESYRIEIPRLRDNIDYLRTGLETVERALDAAYDENIIFRKYRSFAPIATMLEYVESGRHAELEGPYGAYNKYEEELRMGLIIDRLDSIIDRLDTIISKLDTVIANQSSLEYAIKQGYKQAELMSRSIVAAINSQTATVQRSNELIAYNNNVAERIHEMQQFQLYELHRTNNQ